MLGCAITGVRDHMLNHALFMFEIDYLAFSLMLSIVVLPLTSLLVLAA